MATIKVYNQETQQWEHLGSGARGIPGKSAYQIAVDNGFVGTEQEWLNSLGGGGGSDKNYLQSFTVSDDILVQHNLSKYPAVSVIDSTGEEVIGDIEHVNISQLRLRFNAPFSGQVVCN